MQEPTPHIPCCWVSRNTLKQIWGREWGSPERRVKVGNTDYTGISSAHHRIQPIVAVCVCVRTDEKKTNIWYDGTKTKSMQAGQFVTVPGRRVHMISPFRPHDYEATYRVIIAIIYLRSDCTFNLQYHFHCTIVSPFCAWGQAAAWYYCVMHIGTQVSSSFLEARMTQIWTPFWILLSEPSPQTEGAVGRKGLLASLIIKSKEPWHPVATLNAITKQWSEKNITWGNIFKNIASMLQHY